MKPGIADSPTEGLRIGSRLGFVRRRIAQQVSALEMIMSFESRRF